MIIITIIIIITDLFYSLAFETMDPINVVGLESSSANLSSH